ncbi:MAG: hypothetical protein F6K47_34590, partial [Symploca sp. SIO2E6]|nr:hypothetical protein [Symploca sp. SIO2E6]
RQEAGGRRQESGGNPDEKNFATMHENSFLRVSASPRLSVSASQCLRLPASILTRCLQADMMILAVGASMGLAILTKATAYIYTFPIIVWFCFSLLKRLRWQVWKPIAVVAVMVLVLNCGHYLRNLDVYGAPIASDPGEPKYTNDIFTASALLSNILRNFGLHLGTPVGLSNAIFDKIINLLHLVLNVEINDPRTTYINLGRFGIPGGLSTIGINATENNTSNTLHFILIVAAIILCLSWPFLRKKRYLLTYLTVVSSIFVLFCFLLKWQWWHSRLHLPIFLLFAPFVGVVLSQIPQHQLVNALAAILILASLPWLFSCRERPVMGEDNIFNTTRIEQYFNGQTSKKKARVRDAYLGGINFLKSSQCSEIGLLLGHNDVEYPIWAVLQQSNQPTWAIQHVKVENPSTVKSEIEPYSSFVPCALFATKSSKYAKSDQEKIVDDHSTYIQAWSQGNIKVFLKKAGGCKAEEKKAWKGC